MGLQDSLRAGTTGMSESEVARYVDQLTKVLSVLRRAHHILGEELQADLPGLEQLLGQQQQQQQQQQQVPYQYPQQGGVSSQQQPQPQQQQQKSSRGRGGASTTSRRGDGAGDDRVVHRRHDDDNDGHGHSHAHGGSSSTSNGDGSSGGASSLSATRRVCCNNCTCQVCGCGGKKKKQVPHCSLCGAALKERPGRD